MANGRVSWRLAWRRSNATAPRRNRFREAKVNPPWERDDWHDMTTGEELAGEEEVASNWVDDNRTEYLRGGVEFINNHHLTDRGAYAECACGDRYATPYEANRHAARFDLVPEHHDD